MAWGKSLSWIWWRSIVGIEYWGAVVRPYNINMIFGGIWVCLCVLDIYSRFAHRTVNIAGIGTWCNAIVADSNGSVNKSCSSVNSTTVKCVKDFFPNPKTLFFSHLISEYVVISLVKLLAIGVYKIENEEKRKKNVMEWIFVWFHCFCMLFILSLSLAHAYVVWLFSFFFMRFFCGLVIVYLITYVSLIDTL